MVRMNSKLKRMGPAAVLGAATAALIFSNAMAGDRIFPLKVVNGLDDGVLTIKVIPGDCYEGDTDTRTVKPHDVMRPLTLARVQGNGCDGKQGEFQLQVIGPRYTAVQGFSFNNEGGLATTAPNMDTYDANLSDKKDDGSYNWVISAEVDPSQLR